MKKFNVNEFISLLILILLEMEVALILFVKDNSINIELDSRSGLFIVFLLLPLLIFVQFLKVFSFNSRKDNSINFLPIVLSLFIVAIFLIVA
ncbi:hypothetical protein [Caproiciproducens sp. MSJ-32]|uniref:hypothetical protein n=1 Tax=Caproiciproducens sp. MSJ-32 TaxID=2841527 RepID=UPI001C128E67|nr:hypothetical protein [Caproiciproducens sp. MSJ-32]MBU5454815.1 hypothetical protein [Caproiciproducens sp. MSJ-32]